MRRDRELMVTAEPFDSSEPSSTADHSPRPRRPVGAARTADDAARRRRVRLVQRWVLNPPMKAASWLGLVAGHVVIETTGRISGRRHRTVVGMRLDGDVGWVVAEQGRHAGYVRNLEANPKIRVRVRRRWRAATAVIVDGDDPQARLDTFAMDRHAAAVRRFGTDLLTVRIDLAHENATEPPRDTLDAAG
jgi:deazaflavin-dependent oxidoreductase (nitroreductase family)